MKTKKVQLVAGVLAALACANLSNAQNTSYNANTIPIGGSLNCALGSDALLSTTGTANVAVGLRSLRTSTAGSYNSALGYEALLSNTADNNTALGFRAMKINSTGTNNTAVGFAALYSNSSGSYNVADGYQALYSNTTGVNNSATGYNALYAGTTGRDNVAYGYNALTSNSTGSYNAAGGSYALTSNVSGFYNSAFGYQALQGNTAANNTAIGFRSLYLNTSGTDNAANGFAALYTNATGSNNSALGSGADVGSGALSNATAIGSGAVVSIGNKVRIGNTTVGVIEGQVAYTFPSDGRFKENITEDVKGLEFIKLLRPVVYNFNTRKFEEFLTKNMSEDQKRAHLDGRDFAPSTAVRQSGFIAQEVEQAAKKSSYDFNGVHVPENENDNYSLAYAEFVVPLVKAVQEMDQQKTQQEQKITELQQVVEKLQQQINDLQKSQPSTTGIGSYLTTDGASMEQNVPNPFSHETVVKFNLPQQIRNASMTVYDLSGKQLKTLPISQRGASSITITSDQLAAGMYVYSIIADGKLVDSKRMVVADK